MYTNTPNMYRVYIYFISGKSLGFLNIDLDSSNTTMISTTSADIRMLIDMFSHRSTSSNFNAVCTIRDKAMYYMSLKDITHIEVIPSK